MSGLEWTTRDGRKIKLKDMSLEHLKSTLGILRKKRKPPLSIGSIIIALSKIDRTPQITPDMVERAALAIRTGLPTDGYDHRHEYLEASRTLAKVALEAAFAPPITTNNTTIGDSTTKQQPAGGE